ncbi:DUF262 domain-containing protein [Arenimonas malthae]|uniref:DUF262 domain-containing protein n=1 Tax=Arenimonas malthae TaxID=354197 RepID=UPI000A045408|nr:DUF262 domain-containing protein [Arenimonas malthae]
MRFYPAEPDISTLFNRIQDGDIDLQPDFQRGEVWPTSKQQRLVDTILRGWVVPPVLLVQDPSSSSKQQVLDGQQRLAAIRDFKLDRFCVDGKIKPADAHIQSLHGTRFSELPLETRKAFDRTTIRIYEVADYKPEEPAEIFFRLNQPTTLTSAEKRNAFFGPVRDQIRDQVLRFEDATKASEWIGFSNSRMAYDDVFARFACTIEFGTLRKKLTASAVNDLYRRDTPLRQDSWDRFSYSIDVAENAFRAMRSHLHHAPLPKLNKATFYSWLVFISRLDRKVDPSSLALFMSAFETLRAEISGDGGRFGAMQVQKFIESTSAVRCVLQIFTDRATSRVSDVSSVTARDFSLWVAWHASRFSSFAGCTDPAYRNLSEFLSAPSEFQSDSYAMRFVDYCSWGESL